MEKKNYVKEFVFIIIIGLFFSCGINNKAEGEIYLVPEKFEGVILVIFDVKNSSKEKYEGEKRVYIIPENGVLETQFKKNKGFGVFPKFYTYNENNEREELEYYTPSDFKNTIDKNKVVVSTMELSKHKKHSYQVFLMGKISNDSLGNGRYRYINNYFKNILYADQ